MTVVGLDEQRDYGGGYLPVRRAGLPPMTVAPVLGAAGRIYRSIMLRQILARRVGLAVHPDEAPAGTSPARTWLKLSLASRGRSI